MTTTPAAWRGIGGFLGGVGVLRRGFALWGRTPKLMLLGALPAAIVGVVVLVGLVLLIVSVDAIAVAITPFAADWESPWREAVRLLAAAAVLAAGVVLLLATYTAVTLTVGDPFYERIHLRVEEALGGFQPAADPGFWRSIGRSAIASIQLIALGGLVALLAFVVGLIPVVGALTAFVIGAFAGGRLLARELVARAFDARGLNESAQHRLRRLGGARLAGFGSASYVLFLIPLASVVAMPAAVAGATLLAREILEVTEVSAPSGP